MYSIVFDNVWMSKLIALVQFICEYKLLNDASLGDKVKYIYNLLLSGAFTIYYSFMLTSAMQFLFASATYPSGQLATQSVKYKTKYGSVGGHIFSYITNN